MRPFNDDPVWQAICASYETTIAKLAHKYSPDGEGFYDDLRQEARIGVYQTRPEQCREYVADRDYSLLMAGTVPPHLDRYVRNVIRNSVLSYIASYKTGPWEKGRTRQTTDKEGNKIRHYRPAKYTSLELLVDQYGFDVDTDGAPTWEKMELDGLPTAYVAPFAPWYVKEAHDVDDKDDGEAHDSGDVEPSADVAEELFDDAA